MKLSAPVSLVGLQLHRDSATPLHRQLYDGLRQAILAGQLVSGARLPSTRSLAEATIRRTEKIGRTHIAQREASRGSHRTRRISRRCRRTMARCRSIFEASQGSCWFRSLLTPKDTPGREIPHREMFSR